MFYLLIMFSSRTLFHKERSYNIKNIYNAYKEVIWLLCIINFVFHNLLKIAILLI
jgi:hypothetical protein